MYECMRKTTILILLTLAALPLRGQAIRISDFKLDVADGAAADVRIAVTDPDGELCAALKLETRLSGWTFEAGLNGVMDVRYGDGVIYVYVPRGTRKISVGHKDYTPLRDWLIPITLEAGRTYSMKLSTDKPKPAPKPRRETFPEQTVHTIPTVRTVAPVEPMFCTHFADAYVGFQLYRVDDEIAVYDYWAGLSYTWLEKRVGAYVSTGFSIDDIMFSLIAGPAVRLTRPETSSLDLQIYGGAGFAGGSFAVDTGIRFAWHSEYDVSMWDFGVGCHYNNGSFTPTISVGLCIWGIPVIIGVGVVLVALGAG